MANDTPDWNDALCADPWIDPAIFFNYNTTNEAVEICYDCPIMLICAEYALKHKEPSGVWGGLTEAERQKLIAKKR